MCYMNVKRKENKIEFVFSILCGLIVNGLNPRVSVDRMV